MPELPIFLVTAVVVALGLWLLHRGSPVRVLLILGPPDDMTLTWTPLISH